MKKRTPISPEPKVARSGSEDSTCSKEEKIAKRSLKEVIKTLPSLVWVDIAAKIFHHFADGAVIGASFITSSSSGIALAIAVGAHELSTSLGQFAMYIAVGVPKRWTVLLVALSGLSGIFGGVLTVLISSQLKSSGVLAYIPTFAAGMFLYLTLADLLPLVLHEQHGVHDATPETPPNNQTAGFD